MSNNEENMSHYGTGVNIFLFLDYSLVACKQLSGNVILGEIIKNDYNSTNNIKTWVYKAYIGIIKTILEEMNFQNNLLAVTIWGDEKYVMTDLTNDRNRLEKCINLNKFSFCGGDLCAGGNYTWGDYNPYKEIYNNVINSRKVYPEKKSVGIVITQRNIPNGEKEDAFKAVECCRQRGVEIVTIGVQNKNANYEVPIDTNEIKLLSNVKGLGIVCEYDVMLEQLKKIMKGAGKFELIAKKNKESSKEIRENKGKNVRQKRVDEYEGELSKFKDEYESIPEVKLHKLNIENLRKRKNRLINSYKTEYLGLGWIFALGILGLLFLILEHIANWIEPVSLIDEQILALKMLPVLGIPIFGVAIYFLKDSYKHFIANSFVITIIIAGVISYMFKWLSMAIIYIYMRLDKRNILIGTIFLIVALLLIVKKVVRETRYKSRSRELSQIGEKLDIEMDEIRKIICAEYKEIYDKYADIGLERKKVEKIGTQFTKEFRERYESSDMVKAVHTENMLSKIMPVVSVLLSILALYVELGMESIVVAICIAVLGMGCGIKGVRHGKKKIAILGMAFNLLLVLDGLIKVCLLALV